MMKMAKASEADLKMAMDLCTALESFERYRCFPEAMRPDPDDLAPFDADNGEHCREAMEHLLTLVRSASLMRVVYGMAVVVDPRNEVVDPDADTLEVHPKFAALEADAARLRWMLAGNGYFLEEAMLCGNSPCSEKEQAEARHRIDDEMKTQNVRAEPPP
jgi:hypothetical protein